MVPKSVPIKNRREKEITSEKQIYLSGNRSFAHVRYITTYPQIR